MRLTVERGFDQVTVEAIAEAANISRRTFSNYFACKEEALLHGERLYIDAFVRHLRERPQQEAAWSSLRAAVRVLYSSWGRPMDREWSARARLARDHPSLLARQLANQARLAQDLEAALDGRAGPPGVRHGVLVAVFLAGLRTAVTTWSEEGERTLLTVVDEVLDEVEAPFGG
ncbi:TetR family transcriptional regulator [Nocardiopsis tropica]|uniref:TetR family transcriptional regulator n=1 Tax=Nocardiopsis tropica TaxID=109330 RepID=A0ABU7KSA3_9ACTN|nr:TetR family transcriptional regulator [Nocardiopsis umidischolae]MEE2052173.1 TetR family transcriptional regulator [Nocardiopsis umidischolae]